MTRHPLDGNAITADRHYDRDDDTCECGGAIEVTPPDEDNPRGSARCGECGEVPDAP